MGLLPDINNAGDFLSQNMGPTASKKKTKKGRKKVKKEVSPDRGFNDDEPGLMREDPKIDPDLIVA